MCVAELCWKANCLLTEVGQIEIDQTTYMAIIKKNGYKFSETEFGKQVAERKQRDDKYNTIVTFFAILFGAPFVFLIGRIVWNLAKKLLGIE